MEPTSFSTVAIAAAIARGIELAGITVMVVGALLAMGRFLLRVTHRRDPVRDAKESEVPFDVSYRELRALYDAQFCLQRSHTLRQVRYTGAEQRSQRSRGFPLRTTSSAQVMAVSGVSGNTLKKALRRIEGFIPSSSSFESTIIVRAPRHRMLHHRSPFRGFVN